MAQGQQKLKKGRSSKKSYSRKPLRPKKGARTIAPKKTKHVKAAKVKKGLEKAIKAQIESVITQAASKEAKPFRLIKPLPDESKQKKSAGKSKKKEPVKPKK